MVYELGNFANRGWHDISSDIHIKEKEIGMICPKCNKPMERVEIGTRKGAVNVFNSCADCQIKFKE